MAPYLFDTGGMGDTALDMGRAVGELLGRIVGLSAAGVLMPPSLEVETAEVVAGAAADLTDSAAFYAANAANLAERTLLVLAENGATGIGARLESVAIELRTVSSALAGGGTLLGVNPMSLEGEIGRGFSAVDDLLGSGEVWGLNEDVGLLQATIDGIAGDSKLIVSDGDLALDIARDPLFRLASRVSEGLGYLALPFDVSDDWSSTQGESLAGREFSAVGTAEGDLATMIPVVAGANAISGGAVNDDFRFISDIGGGFISGGGHGANEALNRDADLVADGKLGGPVAQDLSDAVNWAVDKSYAPVAQFVGDVNVAVSSTASTATHLAGDIGHRVTTASGDAAHVVDDAGHAVGSAAGDAEHAVGGTAKDVESWL